jgi:hypothetical protein
MSRKGKIQGPQLFDRPAHVKGLCRPFSLRRSALRADDREHAEVTAWLAAENAALGAQLGPESHAASRAAGARMIDRVDPQAIAHWSVGIVAGPRMSGAE